MRLRTRLTAALVTVATIGTLLLGGVAISEVRKSRIDAVDRSLMAVSTQVASNPADPIAAAMLAVDQSPSAVALGFHAKGSPFTWLRDLSDTVVPTPSSADRNAAADGATDMRGGFRLLAVHLQDGADLYVVASLDGINRQTSFDMVFLATFWLALSLLMGVVIRILVRRDVRDIEQLVQIAGRVADGASAVEIPEGSRATEVGELATALRTMVSSLQDAVRVEQSSNQRMQEFLGDASHELRTPLTVIKGYLELLERDVEPEQRERAMRRMRSEAQRMESLINDLLFLAEIGSPVREQLERIDLSDLARVLAEDLGELQPGREIAVSVDPHVMIHGIQSHVYRALSNAFANIRRHTAETDSVSVTLRVEQGLVRLTIEDGGPGLSADMYERGIAHFQRFDRSRSRGTGGSGLGMSIIAAVMRETGGDVTIRRSSLGGLCVEYMFPAAT